MRLRRLVFDLGDGEALALDLHPRVTVVAGMHPDEQAALADELIGAMAGTRPGVSCEVEGLAPGKVPSLLARLELASPENARVARFCAADGIGDHDEDAAITTLASVDQRRLWAAADAVSWAEAKVATEADASEGDRAAVQRVEASHAAREAAAERFESIRKVAFYVSGFCGLVALPAVLRVGAPGLAFVAIAMLGALASFAAWRKLVQAQRAEQEALEAAGAESYLGFNLQQHGDMPDEDRLRLMTAGDARREALASWQRLAGDVDVSWALHHREEIEAAAALRYRIDTVGAFGSSELAVDDPEDDEVIHALLRRMAEARTFRGEGVPLVLVEPFTGVGAQVKPFVLELLSRANGNPQLIVLTGDEEVASWARLEQLTGDVAVIAPHGAQFV